MNNTIKYITIIMLFSGIVTYAQGQSVGVNTVNPLSLFHIDSQGNTAGVNNVTDDVVINVQGNLAIGTQLAPADAKLTLAAGETLIIQDGTEVVGRALTSDANGNVYWGNVVGSNGIFLARVQIGPIAPSPRFTLTFGANNILPNSQYTAPVSGLYFFELKTWFDYPATTHVTTTTHHIRLVNIDTGLMLDEYEHYQTLAVSGANTQAVGIYTVLSTLLNAGDRVQLTSRPTHAVSEPGVGAVPTGEPFILTYRAAAPFEYVVKQYNVR